MKKLTQEEKVAATIAVLVTFAITPMIFASPSVSLGNGFDMTFENKKESTKVVSIHNTDFEIIDYVDGEGEVAQTGDVVYVHYVGQFEDGTVFDNSTGNKEPFSVTLGSEAVIQGWDIGLLGMREGGTRRLVIPASLAYGDQAIVATDGTELIPANSTLIFDIILMKVEKPL